ncbi:uncharacterized protein LOC141601360 [Silene latifolia]|uniref:uncharacterized protein LOC141601360 n=1 Tax=Silene latifolia TaxID=37657 RepID=UPI003D780D39
MNDSCLDNVNVSVPELDVVKEVSVDTAMDVLEKEVSGSTSAGVNAVMSRNKRKRPKRNSAKCGVNSIAQDNVGVSIPETDVIEKVPSNLTTSVLENEVLGGVNNVVSKKSKRKRKKEALDGLNSDMGVLEKEVSVSAGVISTMGVLEKEALAEVNGNVGVLEKDVSPVVNDVVPKKSRRKRKKEALAGVNSDMGVLEKEVSVSAGVISTMGVLEREALAEVNGNIGLLEKDVSAVVNDVVSKKRKRKCKRLDNVSVGNPITDVEEVSVQSNLTSSPEKFHIPPIDTTMGILEKEVSVGVDVVVSKKKKRKPKRSTMEMTCLDNVSVGIPKTDVREEVPVESNLTSSDEKFHISPIDTTMGVLDMEVLASAGVDDVVSKKRKRKPKRLDNVNVGTPKTDVLEEGPVESNLACSPEKLQISPVDTTLGVLEKEVSDGVNAVVSKKKKRKPKRSSIEMTCLDNVSDGIPKTDGIEELLVESNLTSSPEKFHISSVDTRNGDEEKEVSGGVDVVVSKKKKRKPKHSTMEMTCLDNVSVGIPKTDALDEVQVQLNLTSSGEKFHISPVDTTVGVLDKEVSASAGVDDVVSKKRKRKPKRLDNVNVGTPNTDVLEEGPVESNLACSPEKLQISPVDTTLGVLEKEVSDGVNAVVSKKKKRKTKRSSIEMTCLDNVSDGIPKTDGIEELLVESNLTSSPEKFHISSVDTRNGDEEKEVSGGVDVVVSKKKKRKPKHSTMEMTCLDNVSVGIPKTDALEEVQVQLNLTSSGEKFHISPVDTTVGVLDKEVSASAGVDDVVSKKRKRKPKLLDNVNVGTPKTDVLEEVPVESNLTCSREKLHISPADTTMDVLEKEVSGGVNISVKKRERKSKLKKMNDCSSIKRTCLDNVTVKPVSGVTDNISLSDINNDVMANDHPVATCSVNVNSNGNPLDTTTILKSRRKLLVLDVNGLLADIVSQCPRRFKPDFTLAKKIVFKRPFCDDFLRFCFEKFDVGIWSSRTKKNLTRAVDLLMNNMKDKLLFCWDGSRCTNTGFKTLEDKHKPLVLKELKNLWESKANHLPSQRRFYDESNTILLDDSPYKALRNPPYTAIHPKAYSFADVKDKSLGPNGDIRLYLERLAEAENVQEFIQANPFGHQSITNAHPSWNFYSKIVRNQAGKRNFNYQRP